MNADVGQHVICEYLHRHRIEHEMITAAVQ